jgi:ABC-type sulfate/molybdate transport systems ATPase subunit
MQAGRIVQQGAPADCYRHPASLAAARLLGEALALDCTVSNGTAQSCLGRHAAPGVADGPATLVVRPNAISLDVAGTAATVGTVRPCGGGYRVSALVGAESVSLTVADAPPAPGSRIGLALRGPASGIFARSA